MASVAVTVKLKVPVAVGVPERTPPEERTRPLGRLPAVRLYVTGAVLPLDRGSAGHALTGDGARGAWVESIEERESGVAGVSAAVTDRSGAIVAAVSVSGPLERMSAHPGERFGLAVLAAARQVGELVR